MLADVPLSHLVCPLFFVNSATKYFFLRGGPPSGPASPIVTPLGELMKTPPQRLRDSLGTNFASLYTCELSYLAGGSAVYVVRAGVSVIGNDNGWKSVSMSGNELAEWK